MGRPCGLVINRSLPESRMAHDFADRHDIPILLEIPDSREIAEGYSRGRLITDIKPELKKAFVDLLEKVTFIAAARRTKA
jgi:MinD superfamily P-loop ATPase